MPLLATLGIYADDALDLPWGLFWELTESAERDRIRQAQLTRTANGMAFGSYGQNDSRKILRSWEEFLALPKEERSMSIDEFTDSLAAMMGARS